MENKDNKIISIENTKFIFDTNFSGDPTRDKYGDTRRKCNILIPDADQAEDLLNKGIRVKETRPGQYDDPETFVPRHFVQATLKYRDKFNKELRYPPKVYLVNSDNIPVPLSEDTVSVLDQTRVSNVNVILNAWELDDGGYSLYIRTMYVEQDIEDDPYAARYAKRRNGGEE